MVTAFVNHVVPNPIHCHTLFTAALSPTAAAAMDFKGLDAIVDYLNEEVNNEEAEEAEEADET